MVNVNTPMIAIDLFPKIEIGIFVRKLDTTGQKGDCFLKENLHVI